MFKQFIPTLKVHQPLLFRAQIPILFSFFLLKIYR
ncbi:unnamed protein product [Ranitomeya imitator]|uniref:Uncharacterized protein n=1 Tax=Ranitomeya imitator TaxID=111125 RepID=A0ABN9LZZ7_9NEOB|nr:unnamed protein product [Ranitomeya imitator]